MIILNKVIIHIKKLIYKIRKSVKHNKSWNKLKKLTKHKNNKIQKGKMQLSAKMKLLINNDDLCMISCIILDIFICKELRKL